MPTVINSQDFSAQPGGNKYTLSSFLSFAQNTALLTTQTSASTVVTGFTANDKRTISLDGTNFALSIDNAGKQWHGDSDRPGGAADYTVNASITKVTGQSDAAGGSVAVSITNGAAGQLVQANGAVTAATLPFQQSCWAIQANGNTAAFRFVGATSGASANFTPPSTWTRYDFTGTSGAAHGNWFVDCGRSALTAIKLYGSQQELSKYPTPLMISVGNATFSRVAGSLQNATPSTDCPGGYFFIEAIFRPLFTSSEAQNDLDIFFIDSNNRLFLRNSDNKIVLTLGGSTLITTSALTWSRWTQITVQVHHWFGGLSVVVSGATTGNGTTSTSAASAVTVTSAYFMGNASGAQECTGLSKITTYQPWIVLAASSSESSSGSATLGVTRNLAASGSETSSSTTTATVARHIVAAGTETGTGTGNARVARHLVGASTETGTGAAGVGVVRPLAAAATEASSGSAALDNGGGFIASGVSTSSSAVNVVVQRWLIAVGIEASTGTATLDEILSCLASPLLTSPLLANIELDTPLLANVIVTTPLLSNVLLESALLPS